MAKTRLVVPTIMSGLQRGTDQGAAQGAIDMSVPHWGWCPQGRKDEEGIIPEQFQAVEAPSANPLVRTEFNVRDSTGTLLIVPGLPLTGGTKRTEDFCRRWDRPCMIVETDETDTAIRSIPSIMWWLEKYGIEVLNVAGPRASKWQKGYFAAYWTVSDLIWAIRQEVDRRPPF